MGWRMALIIASLVFCLGYGMAEDAVAVNPNPFWCNNVPDLPACAQPAIPICCGPCYQSGGPVATAGGGSTQAADLCPIACPQGWSTWGSSDSCYLMPSQPLNSDTFWNQQAYCKSKDPTANILVIDTLIEQAQVSAVSLQYAPNWAAQLTNVYWWLGGYTSPEGWKFVDGTDQSNSPLMLLANLVADPKQNGTCIGAEAKTLGEWQTYACNERTGAVICEMAKKPVCGPTGGDIPVSPISLTDEKLKELFPKAPSIPFMSSIFAAGSSAGG